MRYFTRLGAVLLFSALQIKCWQIRPDNAERVDNDLEPLTKTIVDNGMRMQLQSDAYANASVPGMPRGPKRRSFQGRLDARQDNFTCTNPGYILVCPSTEVDPCCDPAYPICCHDPSNTCCPNGTFCQGLQTCCITGATGCGEGCCIAGVPCCNGACCASTSYICDTSGTAPTCVINPSLSSQSLAPSATQSQTQETASHATASSDPTQSGNSNNNNNGSSDNKGAIIGGAVGGGVAALVLIALLAWWILRKPPTPIGASKTTTPAPTGVTSPVTPYNGGGGYGGYGPGPNHPLMAPTPSAYGGSNGTPATFTTNSTNPPMSQNQPYRISTYVTSAQAGGGPGLVTGAALGAGAVGAAEAMEHRPPSGQANQGFGYQPPPPEGAGANYYANTPLANPALAGPAGGVGYNAYSGPAPPMSGGGASGYQTGDERPPWMVGSSTSGSPPPPSTHPGTAFSPAPTTTSGGYAPSQGTYTPPPPSSGGPQPFSIPTNPMSPPPTVFSPPPPFTPAPGGGPNTQATPWTMGADASGSGDLPSGRVVGGPGDSKASYSGTGR